MQQEQGQTAASVGSSEDPNQADAAEDPEEGSPGGSEPIGGSDSSATESSLRPQI